MAAREYKSIHVTARAAMRERRRSCCGVGRRHRSAAQRQQLALADPDRGRGQRPVALDQLAQRRDLLRVRGGVVGHQHPAGAQHPRRVRPPRRVLGALGVEEQQVDLAVAEAGQRGAAVLHPEVDEVGEPGLRHGAPGVLLRLGVGVDREHPAAGAAGRVGEPERGDAARRADLDDRPGAHGLGQEPQEAPRVGLQHAPPVEPVGLPGVVPPAARSARR